MFTVHSANRTRETSETAEGGFSLLDLVLALAVTAVSLTVIVPICLRPLQAARLQSTSEQLVWNLRRLQSASQIQGTPGMIEFARYNPYYFVDDGANVSKVVRFEPGVNYVDGYLQMQAGRVAYSTSGNSAVGGTIRLTTGSDEEDIQLYLGSGLQVLRSKP